MKKLLISIGLVAATYVASAQNFQSPSFLNVGAIYMTNSITFVTNLDSTVANPAGTNLTSVIATNLSGTAITGSNVWRVNLLRTVNLPVDRNAERLVGSGTNACILLKVISAGAAATNAISLEFVPVPNGTDEDNTATAITFSTTGVTSVAGNWRFNLNAGTVIGCKSLRLRKIYSLAPAAADAGFVIDDVQLCGFYP